RRGGVVPRGGDGPGAQRPGTPMARDLFQNPPLSEALRMEGPSALRPHPPPTTWGWCAAAPGDARPAQDAPRSTTDAPTDCRADRLDQTVAASLDFSHSIQHKTPRSTSIR